MATVLVDVETKSDDSAIKYIDEAEEGLMKTTESVLEHEEEVFNQAKKLQEMALEIQKRETKLTGYANSLLSKRKKLDEDMKKFRDKMDKAEKEFQQQVVEAHEKMSDLSNNLILTESKEKNVTTGIANMTNIVTELDNKLLSLTSNVDKSMDIIDKYKPTSDDYNIEMLSNSVKEYKEKVNDIEMKIISQKESASRSQTSNINRIMKRRELEAVKENLTQKLLFAKERFRDELQKQIDKTNIENTYMKPQTMVISLKNESEYLKSKLKGMAKAYTKINEELNNYKTSQISAYNMVKSKKNTVLDLDVEKNKYISMLDNIKQSEINIKAIRAKTISELKTKSFELKKTITEERVTIDKLILQENVLNEKIREVNTKIECARADFDQIFTNELAIKRLKADESILRHKKDSKFENLEYDLSIIKQKIIDAELEAKRLNVNCTGLHNNSSQFYDKKSDELSEIKTDIKTLKELIHEFERRNENLNKTLSIKKKELNTRTRANLYYQMKLDNIVNKYNRPSRDLSPMELQVESKKQAVEERRKIVANKWTAMKLAASIAGAKKVDLSPSRERIRKYRKNANKHLTTEDLIWAFEAEAYVWKSDHRTFANNLLLSTWDHQLDLFF